MNQTSPLTRSATFFGSASSIFLLMFLLESLEPGILVFGETTGLILSCILSIPTSWALLVICRSRPSLGVLLGKLAPIPPVAVVVLFGFAALHEALAYDLRPNAPMELYLLVSLILAFLLAPYVRDFLAKPVSWLDHGNRPQLKQCRSCGKDLQHTAAVCPHCGREQRKGRERIDDGTPRVLSSEGQSFLVNPQSVIRLGVAAVILLPLVVYIAVVDAEAFTTAILAISTFMVAFTLSVVMAALGIRMFRQPPSGTVAWRGQWDTGILAGSIALFGILITGVFVFMSLRIETTARQAAAAAAVDAAVRNRLVSDGELIDSAVRQAVAEVARRADSFEDPDPVEPELPLITPTRIESVTLERDERRRFRLQVSTPGDYRIEANATSEGFDPYIYLFDQNLNLVTYNDDGGDGLNSSLVEYLIGGATYYLDVEELVGEPGSCNVSVDRID